MKNRLIVSTRSSEKVESIVAYDLDTMEQVLCLTDASSDALCTDASENLFFPNTSDNSAWYTIDWGERNGHKNRMILQNKQKGAHGALLFFLSSKCDAPFRSVVVALQYTQRPEGNPFVRFAFMPHGNQQLFVGIGVLKFPSAIFVLF